MIISTEVLDKAKADMIEFDKQKTYNKFTCSHNYIGLVGEMLFDQYLNVNNVPHEWVQFIKKGYTEPDFIINGLTIDIKSSYSDTLWIGKEPKFDVYILMTLTRDNKWIDIQGYITKEEIIKGLKTGKTKQVTSFGKNSLCIASDDLLKYDANTTFA